MAELRKPDAEFPAYDEAFDRDGSVRPLYAAIVERFSNFDTAELRRREGIIEEEFRRQGITFTVYGDSQGTERTWPMDLFPRLIASAEWREIERGLAQRVTALNRVLADIYTGEGAAMADGVVPAWLVQSSDGFERNGVHGVGALTAATDQQRVDPARSEARWRSDKGSSQRGSHHGDLVGVKIGRGAFERNEDSISQRPQDAVGYSRDRVQFHDGSRNSQQPGREDHRRARVAAGTHDELRFGCAQQAKTLPHRPGYQQQRLDRRPYPSTHHSLHSQGFHPPRRVGHHRPLESATRPHQRHGRIGGLTTKFFGQRERRVKVSSRATCCNYHVHPIPNEDRGRPVGAAREILKRMPIATRLTINEEPP